MSLHIYLFFLYIYIRLGFSFRISHEILYNLLSTLFCNVDMMNAL